MTRTQSDVNELLEAIRAGGDIDVIRRAIELVLQALIEAEAPSGSAPPAASPSRRCPVSAPA